MTTYSRHQLEEALQERIDASSTAITFKIVPDPRDLGELDPGVDCYLQVVRQIIKPSPQAPRGSFSEDHELWVIEGVTALDAGEVPEDALDDKVAEVIDFLDAIDFLTWSKAERGIHKSKRHAYKFTLNITTDRTSE